MALAKIRCADVLDRLNAKGWRVTKSGAGAWRARCPAHGESSSGLNLSIRETGAGGVALKCFSRRCGREEILRALDFELPADPTGTRSTAGAGREVPPARPERRLPPGYPPLLEAHETEAARQRIGRALRADLVRDERGCVWGWHVVKRREAPKPGETKGRKVGPFWYLPDGARSSAGGDQVAGRDEMPLFGSHLVPEFSRDRPIYLTEGEADACALLDIEAQALGTVTGAGGTPCARALAVLQGFRVVLWPDADAEGAAHLRRIAAKLRGVAADLRWIETPPHWTKGEGAADWYKERQRRPAHELLAELEAGYAQLPEAPDTEAEGAADELLGRWASYAKRASDISADPGELVVPVARFLLHPQHLTLFAAREKTGKSTIASQAVAAISTGNRFGGLATQPGLSVWVTEESKATVKGRLHRQGADLSRVIVVPIRELVRASLDLSLGNQAQALDALVRDLAPVALVVDTLDRFRVGIVTDAAKADSWGPLFAPLEDCCRTVGSAMLILHHAKKDGGFRDSTAIGAAVDCLIEPAKETNSKPGGEYRSRARAMLAGEDFRVLRFDKESETVELQALDSTSEQRMSQAHREQQKALRQRVLEFVQRNPGCTTTDLRDGVSGKGAAIDSARDQLQKCGQLLRETGPRNAHRWCAVVLED